jgi:hypothetical protein
VDDYQEGPLKKTLVLALACTFLMSVSAGSQTRRRTQPQKRTTPTSTFAEKQQAEILAGREQIAAQIKALTQFLYLFGGISKGIETAERVNNNHETSSVGMPAERILQNKAKLRESIRNVRTGLEKLESSFRLNPVLMAHYSKLSGVGKLAQNAETQAAANSFDEAGRSLNGAVNKLVDALVALR